MSQLDRTKGEEMKTHDWRVEQDYPDEGGPTNLVCNGCGKTIHLLDGDEIGAGDLEGECNSCGEPKVVLELAELYPKIRASIFDLTKWCDDLNVRVARLENAAKTKRGKK